MTFVVMWSGNLARHKDLVGTLRMVPFRMLVDFERLKVWMVELAWVLLFMRIISFGALFRTALRTLLCLLREAIFYLIWVFLCKIIRTIMVEWDVSLGWFWGLVLIARFLLTIWLKVSLNWLLAVDFETGVTLVLELTFLCVSWLAILQKK